MSSAPTGAPGPRYETLWSVPPGGAPLGPSCVRVRVGPQWNRASEGAAADAAIVEAWRARQQSRPDVVLFNGTKFRLAGVKAIDATASGIDGAVDSGVDSSQCVELQLGVTDYRSTCATNFAADPEAAPVDPDTGAPVLLPHMAAACGVEALVVTSDDQVVLFRRSERVAENPGWYCCPGGHAEPCAALRRGLGPTGHSATIVAAETLAARFPASAATGNFARCDDTDAGSDDAAAIAASADQLCAGIASALGADASCASVLAEMFQAPADEVVEELGVPADKLRCEGLCGVVVASNNAWKPDLVFRVRVAMTSAEVKAVFESGAAREAFESTGALLFIPLAELRRAEAIPETGGVQITPPSLACLRLAL